MRSILMSIVRLALAVVAFMAATSSRARATEADGCDPAGNYQWYCVSSTGAWRETAYCSHSTDGCATCYHTGAANDYCGTSGHTRQYYDAEVY